ncbi:MAG: hypothetical protein EZS28_041586 [Streblomastix strix]|uniref:HTH CENPB-type domain-containing protein n=1 Tax=Streblomastix strix TaxID=222440 RepID=A0A5J4TX97_9EUKA|nr:MAG: hypothetical protein EZS28_041586 [Streblomastix strix]
MTQLFEKRFSREELDEILSRPEYLAIKIPQQKIEMLFRNENVIRADIQENTDFSHHQIQIAFENMKKHRGQGQMGGKRLLEIEEENTIVKIFEDKMMLHDFPTQFDAVEIVKDLIKKNPSRNDVAEKINIQWLERFVGYKKQFKLLRGHVVDQKRFWACTRSNLAPWYQKIRQLRYDSNYLLRNIWNADETGLNLTPRRCNKVLVSFATKKAFCTGHT